MYRALFHSHPVPIKVFSPSRTQLVCRIPNRIVLACAYAPYSPWWFHSLRITQVESSYRIFLLLSPSFCHNQFAAILWYIWMFRICCNSTKWSHTSLQDKELPQSLSTIDALSWILSCRLILPLCILLILATSINWLHVNTTSWCCMGQYLVRMGEKETSI